MIAGLAIAAGLLANAIGTPVADAEAVAAGERLKASYRRDYLSHTAHAAGRCPDWHLNDAAVAKALAKEGK